MNRATALAIIQAHEAELKRLGVASLSLFGSTARDEATGGSDVEVAVQLEDCAGGLAILGRLDEVRSLLAALLGAPVDVVPEPSRPNRIKAAIDRDRCLAF